MSRVIPATLVFLIFALALLAGCGETKEKGPDTAVEDFIHLLNERRFGDAYDMLATTSPFAGLSKEQFTYEMEKMFGGTAINYRLSGFLAKEVVIDDSSATVTWTGAWVTGFRGEETGSIEQTSTVVLEDGVWKVEDLWD